MRKRICMFLILACILGYSLPSQDIQAQWGLTAYQGVVGESLILTLTIEGSDQCDVPLLSLPGVEITFQGGGPRNSTSIVSVNGKTTKTVTKAWTGSWKIKCPSVGTYQLPSINIKFGNQNVMLPSLTWQITEAQNDSRFILRHSLSQEVCIPGIEVEYTLVWYIGESAQNPEFTLPVLDNASLVPVESSFQGITGDIFQFKYGDRILTGLKSIEQLDGRQYTALTVKFKIKPDKPGSYNLSDTMVTFEGAVDSRRVQDFFGNIVEQPSYRVLSARAQNLTLLVKDLPQKGKPVPFSGLIGKLDLSWEGGQGTWSVGEPIRMKLQLNGVLNKPDLDLDYMVVQALNNNDFQVSPDLAATASGPKDENPAGITRSYILRARRPGRLTLPSLALNYFDPKTEQYGKTATKPIVFDIKATPSIKGKGGSGSDDNSGVNAVGPRKDGGENSKAMLNTNGMPMPVWPLIPWWAFALPGLMCAAVIFPIGLWRHSERRLAFLERKAWLGYTGALKAPEGRLALEEGRQRLDMLLNAGSRWKARLQKCGYWDRLLQEKALWDEAFFADFRSDESWLGRWENLRSGMGAWK